MMIKGVRLCLVGPPPGELLAELEGVGVRLKVDATT